MLIHEISSFKQFLEIVETDEKRNGQTNCGPQGVASTYPIPKSKHVFLVDTEFLDFCIIRRQSDKVLGNRRILKEFVILNTLIDSSHFSLN